MKTRIGFLEKANMTKMDGKVQIKCKGSTMVGIRKSIVKSMFVCYSVYIK